VVLRLVRDMGLTWVRTRERIDGTIRGSRMAGGLLRHRYSLRARRVARGGGRAICVTCGDRGGPISLHDCGVRKLGR
jgi:hypothetical protein